MTVGAGCLVLDCGLVVLVVSVGFCWVFVLDLGLFFDLGFD